MCRYKIFKCFACGWTTRRAQEIAPRCCHNWQMIPVDSKAHSVRFPEIHHQNSL